MCLHGSLHSIECLVVPPRMDLCGPGGRWYCRWRSSTGVPPGAGCGQCWLLREVAAYLLTMMAVSGGSHAVILPGVANLHLLLYLHCHACSVWAAAPNAALTFLLPSKASARFSVVLIPLPGARWVTPVTEVGSTGGAVPEVGSHVFGTPSVEAFGSSRQDESGPSLERASAVRHPFPPT